MNKNNNGWKIISNVNDRKRIRTTKRIVSTKILAEWNDSPRMEVLLHDMPNHLAIGFDAWLSDIEAEENAKDKGGVR